MGLRFLPKSYYKTLTKKSHFPKPIILHKNVIFTQSSPPPPPQLHQPPYINKNNDKDTNFSHPNGQIVFKRWHGSHHHGGGGCGSHMNMKNKESENIFRLGLGADIGLTALKGVTGYLSGSTAIIADAAHSLSDVVLSGVALLSYKAARIPRDKEHPYGHGKFETLGALGISGMLLVTAGGIGWHAADVFLGLLTAAPDIVNQSMIHDHGHHHSGHSHAIDMEHPLLALNVIILSIGVKECLFWITKRAGEREGSGLMKANAWHHRADAISSVVALMGVGGSLLGLKFLDPLAGLVVSGMILKAGVETGYHSVLELVDAAVPLQELESHRQTILQVEGVKGCHRLRGRRAGSFLHLDVHIEVDPFASVSAAHHIGENVRRRLHESHPQVAEVFIHIDPAFSRISPVIANCEKSKAQDRQKESVCLENKDIDNVVSSIFSSKFSQKICVEKITPHLLHNKILLEVEVSMPPEIMIKDAMLMAEEAKKEVLGTVANVVKVAVQLQLTQPNHAALS